MKKLRKNSDYTYIMKIFILLNEMETIFIFMFFFWKISRIVYKGFWLQVINYRGVRGNVISRDRILVMFLEERGVNYCIKFGE